MFTFNVRDFVLLAPRHPRHSGIVLAAQSSWTLADLISSLDRLLREAEPAELEGQLVWLNRWRTR